MVSLLNRQNKAIGNRPDYSSRDRLGSVTFYVLLWKRKGIDLQLFSNYWRNVHGPVCARLPGQHQYWQFHLDYNQGNLWRPTEGVEYHLPSEDRFDGIAELTFVSEAERQIWFEAAGVLMNDERNIFSKAIGYNTKPGNSKTYVDRLEVGDPNGALEILKFHAMVKKADGVSISDFRNYMSESFAHLVSRCPSVLKFRLHLFEEVDNSRPDADGVSHYEPPEKQYQAAFEIAFTNALEMEKFFISSEYFAATSQQAKYVKQIATFGDLATYTFVYDDRPTLAGQRGSVIAELIEKVGAINQLQEAVVKIMTAGV